MTKGKVKVMDSAIWKFHEEPRHDPVVASWPKPPDGSLSVDGSYGASNNELGVASAIRYANGDLIIASCKYYERCRDAF